MKEQILILFDREEEYAQLMSDFLRSHKDVPWKVRTYTCDRELLLQEAHTDIAILVVAESAYTESLSALQVHRTVILNESGVVRFDRLPNIDKYQEAESVFKELLVFYTEIAPVVLPKLFQPFQTQFIGIYSPVRRTMQTHVALTMCQMLAVQHRTLYLNFEHYTGISELIPQMQERDLADLLYFLTADNSKFALRLQTIIQKKGQLEYVPPMKSGQNLLTIPATEWISLLQKIEEIGTYEYVVLDLSESMLGLFDILRLCSPVFSLTADDPISQRKMMQYEQLLALYDYQDVLNKTSKYSVPKIHRYPADLQQYTRGELAEYVKGLFPQLWKEEGV